MKLRLSPPMAVVCALLLFAVVALQSFASAFQITAQYTGQLVVNGTTYPAPRTTFSCVRGDWDIDQVYAVQLIDGTIKHDFVHCEPPRHPFRLEYRGSIKDDGEYVQVENCVMRNTARAEYINGSIAHVGSSPSVVAPGRRLLQIDTPASSVAQAAYLIVHPEDVPVYLYRGQGDATTETVYPQSNVTGAICDLLIEPGITTEAEKRACYKGANLDAFNSFKNATADLSTSIGTFARDMVPVEQTSLDILANITQVDTYISNATQITTDRLATISKTNGLINQKITQTSEAVNRAGSQLKQEMSDVSASHLDLIHRMQRVINSTSDADDRFRLNLAQRMYSLMSTSEAFVSSYMIRRGVIYSQLSSLQTLADSADTNIQRFIMDDVMIRAQTEKVRPKLDELSSRANSRGNTITPLTEDLGTPPATDRFHLTAEFASVPVSVDVIRQASVISGVPYGIVTEIRFPCESNFLTKGAPRAPTWRSIAGFIGPSGCDATFVGSRFADRCTCAQRITQSRCVLRNTAGVVSAGDLDQFRNGNADALDTTTGCLSAPTVFTTALGGLDGEILRTWSNVTSAFGALSRVGLYGATEYRITSRYLNLVIDVPYDAAVTNATNLIEIMNRPALVTGGQINLVFAYFQLVERAYVVAKGNLRKYERKIWGDLPNGMDQEEVIYRKFYPEGGGTAIKTGRCAQFGMMMVSDNFVMVSSFTPEDSVTTLRVSINGVNTTAVDVTYTSPYRNYLPVTEGLVWDPATFDAHQWDIDPKDVSLSRYAAMRNNKVTRVIVADRDDYARDKISFLDERELEHRTAGHIIPPYEVQLDNDPLSPTYGQCLTSATVPGGPWCTRRVHFRPVVSGTCNTNDASVCHMTFLDLDATVTGTVAFTMGTPVTYVNSTCPTIELVGTLVSSTNIVTLVIRDPNGESSDFRVEQVGDCPYQKDIHLEPRQSIVIQRPFCPGDFVRSMYIAPSGSGYLPCSGQISLNLTRESARTFVGAASLNMTVSVHIRTDDLVFAAAANDIRRLIHLQARNLLAEFRAALERGERLSNDYIAQATDVFYSLMNHSQSIPASIISAHNDSTQAATTGVVPDPQLDAQIAASQQRSQDDRASAAATIATAQAAQATITADIANLQGFATLEADAIDSMEVGFANFLPKLIGLFGALIPDWNATGLLIAGLGNDGDGRCAGTRIEMLFAPVSPAGIAGFAGTGNCGSPARWLTILTVVLVFVGIALAVVGYSLAVYGWRRSTILFYHQHDTLKTDGLLTREEGGPCAKSKGGSGGSNASSSSLPRSGSATPPTSELSKLVPSSASSSAASPAASPYPD